MNEGASIALFISGALCAGFAVVTAFFFRFWLRTRDFLFAAFSAAFLLMAANQVLAGFAHVSHGENPRAYLLRLAAFLLIIVAVLAKNASDAKPRR